MIYKSTSSIAVALKSVRALLISKSFCIAFLLAVFQLSYAAPLKFVRQTLIQPNGDTLRCFASGDELNNRLHDKDNYTIMQDPLTGYYVYAVKSNGMLAPSGLIAGRSDPASAGIEKGAAVFNRKIKNAKTRLLKSQPGRAANAPSKGTLNNIVVFIRFNDDNEFTDLKSVYEEMFNSSAEGTSSVHNYYAEASYSQLNVNSSFYPSAAGSTVTSYRDSHPRSYYLPYNAVTAPLGYKYENEMWGRESSLLADAVSSISQQIPKELAVDADMDGKVDNICFIVKGDPAGWASILWPHEFTLSSRPVFINGAIINTYNFQLQNSLLTPGEGVGVLCHELFHSIGAPDLYHYTYYTGISPAGPWDIMEQNMNPPQHMTAYMKYRYGKWISSIPAITSPGKYSLHPLSGAANNCYKIASPVSSAEYFIVEYRKKSGIFESSLPGEGLIVYRINPSADGKGNSEGPPDELYVYRPKGNLSSNGEIDKAAFSSNAGRTEFGGSTDPSPFFSNGNQSGLNITDVGSADNTISFTVGEQKSYSICISPDSQNVQAYEGMKIPVAVLIGNPGMVAAPDDFAELSFRLDWDNPEYVGYDSFTAGSFLGNSPACSVQGAEGHLNALLSRTAGGVSGSGIVAICTLKVLKTLDYGKLNMRIALSGISARQSSGKSLLLVPSQESADCVLLSGAPVWAGDADNDGVVDAADVLAVGLHYGRTGAARSNGSRVWEEQVCYVPWDMNNATYADCDGDGAVNSADVLCIGLSYGKIHSVRDSSFTEAVPESSASASGKIYFRIYDMSNREISSGAVKKGDEFYIAAVADGAKDLLGLSCDITSGCRNKISDLLNAENAPDGNSVKAGEVWGENIISMGRASEDGSKISVAISKTDGKPVKGSCTEMFRLKLKAAADSDLNFSIENICANDNEGNKINMTSACKTELAKERNKTELPSQYGIKNYPNPFNPSTRIEYQLPKAGVVKLKVYDVLGREVVKLVDGYRNAGSYSVNFDAGSLSGGAYIYELRSGNYHMARKMLLVR